MEKLFRIYQYENGVGNELCNKIILLAASLNGRGGEVCRVDFLKQAADEANLSPESVSVEMVGGNGGTPGLAIDIKVGEGYERGAYIEEVEIFEIVPTFTDLEEEKDDIPASMFQSPGLHNLGDN